MTYYLYVLERGRIVPRYVMQSTLYDYLVDRGKEWERLNNDIDGYIVTSEPIEGDQ